MPKVKRQIDVVAIEDTDDYVSARRALEKPADDIPEAPPEAPLAAPPEAPLEAPQVVEDKEEKVETIEPEVEQVKPAPKRAPRKKVAKG